MTASPAPEPARLPPVAISPQHCGQTMQAKPIERYSGPVTRWHCLTCGIDTMMLWATPEDMARAADAVAFLFGAAAVRCDAVIWHGPGHQSRTRCRLTGEHEIHEAIYGEFSQYATWRSQPDGGSTFSGVFDEPPTVED